jgi:hypothetical protein
MPSNHGEPYLSTVEELRGVRSPDGRHLRQDAVHDPDFVIIAMTAARYLDHIIEAMPLPYFAYADVDANERWLVGTQFSRRAYQYASTVEQVELIFHDWASKGGPVGRYDTATGEDAPDDPSEDGRSPRSLGPAVEAFVGAWQAYSDEALMSEQERDFADDLTRLMGRASVLDDPPRPFLRAAAEWFGGKLDVFATEFAKTTGKAAGVGAGVTVTGNLPRVLEALAHLKGLL